MNFKKLTLLTTALILISTLTGANAMAQCTGTVFASGLLGPIKIITAQKDRLLVAESGFGPNMGRISIIDNNGNVRTLIDGLPAGFNGAAGGPSGPQGLLLRGRTLYIVIGEADATLPGPFPGTEIANPSPSSPIISSVLAVHFSSQVEMTTQGFSLTLADHFTLKNSGRVVIKNGAGERITIELLADFPDHVPNPQPGVPNAVRPSNPFGLTILGNDLYVVDAGMNLVKRVSVNKLDTEVVTVFAPLAKPPAIPFGPPFIDAVPDSIRVFGNDLLVPLLTGFPFVPGLAEVRKVDILSGSSTSFISGLTSAIDVLPVKSQGGADQFFTLEFSANMLADAPGRLRLFASPGGPAVTVTDCLISPSSFAFDQKSGALFVTEVFTGRIIRVQAPGL